MLKRNSVKISLQTWWVIVEFFGTVSLKAHVCFDGPEN